MLVERADLLIRAGMEEEFAKVMAEKGVPLLRQVDGVGIVQIGRGVENPDKFMLMIEWATMDAHSDFKTNPLYEQFRALLGPFACGGAMEHFVFD